MNTTCTAYVDFGALGTPGVYIEQEYDAEPTFHDDPACRSWDADDDARDRWDAVCADHGWRRVSDWQIVADQATATVVAVASCRR